MMLMVSFHPWREREDGFAHFPLHLQFVQQQQMQSNDSQSSISVHAKNNNYWKPTTVWGITIIFIANGVRFYATICSKQTGNCRFIVRKAEQMKKPKEFLAGYPSQCAVNCYWPTIIIITDYPLRLSFFYYFCRIIDGEEFAN